MKKNTFFFFVLFLGAIVDVHAQQDLSLSGLVVRQNSRVKSGQVEYLSKVRGQQKITSRFNYWV